MKTQVAIVGAGPAGSLLSLLLGQAGVDNVVLERQSRAHVLGRIRAGVLEYDTVETLRAAGVGARMDREGHAHDTINIGWRGEALLQINTKRCVGKPLMAYGQASIQEDLYAALDATGAAVLFDLADVAVHEVTGSRPSVTFAHGGSIERLEADYIVGCDGFHGVSRQTIPVEVRKEYEKVYPFGWLGILSRTPPLPIIMYAQHERGFALCSMRSPTLSRYYVQCPAGDSIEDWPDDRFWSELLRRVPPEQRQQITTGPSVEKSIAPLRSFVSEPMRYGSLFLAGDAAHIVPPTGAKGLNLAVSDVRYLSRGLIDHYNGDDRMLDTYSERALRRVWGAVRFSWWLSTLLHRFPGQTPFDLRIQEQELYHLSISDAAQTAFAEQFVGLPYEQ
jgi:p-hydroxybenzoate 3-monooxygenase